MSRPNLTLFYVIDDDEDEYECIDGNHRLVALRERHFQGTWSSIVLVPDTPEEGTVYP